MLQEKITTEANEAGPGSEKTKNAQTGIGRLRLAMAISAGKLAGHQDVSYALGAVRACQA